MSIVRSMRSIAVALLAANALPAFANVKVEQILAASDAIRNPAVPFTINIQLTEYRNRQVEQEGYLSTYAKMNPDRGQFDTLVRIVQPARDNGKMMLKNGNEIWFYDPATKAGMRISPQQRLLGQASNGDVATVNLARDYAATLAGEETVSDGDRKPRNCLRLRLTANNPSVSYHAIDYWVEQGSNRPVKAAFFAESGRLLKTAYYRRYESQLGQERPTETVIIDGVDPQRVTVMRYLNYRARDIPDAWLERSGLAQVKD
ncbi:outer membrane lipoprotein-sorting protein [Chitiniphilus shinanonensis]|uniref:outer membrane lipoprotein-sorting protein n=1 Tax=Chitiniphilus shinanonensis TaxID=553088 RepID=UPI0003A914EA|nr:outer membrane lipoprotein-sorting protein [Chitiniphilus shinanonensis]